MQDDERRIAAEISNIIRLSEKRCEPCFTDFLSEGGQAFAQLELQKSGCTLYEYWGGFSHAERRVLCVYPEYAKPEPEDYPIQPLHVKFRRTASLSHRDFLGALMSLGIKREAVGDIVINEGTATFFVKTELAPYITAQIEKIGREGVTFCESGADLDNISRKFEEKSRTVSSIRLDSVVAECADISRSKAQNAIKSGAVSVNALTMYDGDKKLSDGDTVSVRGHGKFELRFDGSMSKKGKYKITILKYI